MEDDGVNNDGEKVQGGSVEVRGADGAQTTFKFEGEIKEVQAILKLEFSKCSSIRVSIDQTLLDFLISSRGLHNDQVLIILLWFVPDQMIVILLQ